MLKIFLLKSFDENIDSKIIFLKIIFDQKLDQKLF